ncbi:MAG: hypothetical protein ACRC6R_06010 [Bacteroidales bacterium]
MKKCIAIIVVGVLGVSCGQVATATETHLEVNNVGINSVPASGWHYDFQQCMITSPDNINLKGDRVYCTATNFSIIFREDNCSSLVSVYAGINGISVSATNAGCTSDIDEGQGLGYIGFVPYPKAYYTTFDGWTSMGVSK